MSPSKSASILAFIRSQQKSDGSFDSLSLRHDESSVISLNTFTTSLILASIGTAPEASNEQSRAESEAVASRGIYFLMREKSPLWSWNYWQRGNVDANKTPCPDDLDDTSMALIALTLHRPTDVTGEALACVTKLLTLTEDAVGGPYHTWIVDRTKDDRWNDLDIVVNSNVAYFLKLHGVTLPNLTKLTEQRIRENKLDSKYYSPIAIAYFISRWYGGPLAPDLQNIILSHRQNDGSWGDTISTSLAVSALANLDAPIESFSTAAEGLSRLTSWEPVPFYVEAIKEKKPIKSGSSALTAALCLEALRSFERAKTRDSKRKVDKTPPSTPSIQERTEAERTHEDIVRRVSGELSFFPEKTKAKVHKILERMIARDPGRQITLLAYHFAQGAEAGRRVSSKLISDLGAVNLFGWLAYKIYDDILDDEGDPGLLPVANYCLRAVTELCRDALPVWHAPLFNDLMNGIERSNAWEREFCRIGVQTVDGMTVGASAVPVYSNYDVLADKSLAHALGPASIIIEMGGPSAETDLRQTLSFFRNYIIARQLNDDAHDWLADLERGFANSVSSKILKLHFSRTAPHTLCNIQKQKVDLERIFWKDVSDGILDDITSHINQARKNLDKISVLKDKTYLDSLLTPLEKAVLKTTTEKNKAAEFISSYSNPSTKTTLRGD